VSTINAPVFDHDGHVSLVLCLTGFAGVLSGAAVEAAGRRLVRATEQISNALRGAA
jgi:DNA-binding IclR family transcriptional regulator